MKDIFSERNGFVDIDLDKPGTLNEACKNRLWNCVLKIFEASDPDACSKHFFEINQVLDRIGKEKLRAPYESYKKGISIIHDFWMQEWYCAFDVLEEILSFYMTYEMVEEFKSALGLFNEILEEEKSAYRFIENKAIPITSNMELRLLEENCKIEFESVQTHLEKALDHYSDRVNPDYNNSIKESISAVEAICCIITNSKKSTLGDALKKLKENGIVIHEAMEKAFSKLYGYTSDAGGIRHGSIVFTDAPAEDAKYMLLSCSAFVHYLVEKYSRVGGKNNG